MTTPHRRALVSLSAVMTITITLALGACARTSSRPMPIAPSPVNALPTIRFDNDGREHVHVYLISENRQWLLGRVEPGSIAALRIPDEALAENTMFVRLAVLTGGRVAFQAARDARAVTIRQPALAILSQRWWFSRGELTSVRR